MTGIDSYSPTAATNATAGSVNFAEGQAPSTVNNSARQVMADLRRLENDRPWFQYGTGDQGSGHIAVPAVYASSTSFTIAGVDVTAAFHKNRRLRAVGSSTGTIYGKVISASFSTNTTAVCVWDSGSLSNEPLTVSLSQIGVTGSPTPMQFVDVRAFGVIADGSTDDYAALNAAAAYARTNNQVKLIFPADGSFALSQTLNLSGICINGAGSISGTVFKALSGFTSGTAVILIDDTQTAGGVDSHYCNFRIDINSISGVIGLKLEGNVLYNSFQNIRINNASGVGILIDGKAGPVRPTLCTFINCHVGTGASHGLQINAGRNLSFHECAFETLTGTGINVTSSTEACSKLGFYRPYIENVQTDGIVFTSCDQSEVVAPLVSGYGKTSTASYGFKNTGTSCSRNKLYGGDFAKNASPHVNSRDIYMDGGDRLVLENISTTDFTISGNRAAIISNLQPSVQSLMAAHFVNGQTTVAGGVSTYLSPCAGIQGLTEANISGEAPGYMSLSQLRFKCGAPGGSDQYTATLYVDGNVTAMTAAIVGAATAAQDLTHEIMLAPGQRYSVQLSASATAATIAQNNARVSIGVRHN